MRATATQTRLLDWYARVRRDLPWRRTRDPYAIWVSEVMLQQTRVDTATPYFERWMRRFPDVATLARAPLDDVLALWQGLGYYARARHLHAAAAVVVSEHGGRVPRERAARLALPGVGRYTAGAIGSIAFGLAEPVLDGNVERVLCRLTALREDPRRPAVREALWTTAASLVQGSASPGELNQALMELGATVCTPETPRCDACPLARACAAHRLDLTNELPALAQRKRAPVVHGVACRIERAGKWLVVRRPPGGLLGGLWELPGGDGRGRATLERLLREKLGVRASVGPRVSTVTHVFTHRRLSLAVYDAQVDAGRGRAGRPPGYAERRWVSPAALLRLPVSTLYRKVFRALSSEA